MITVDGVRTPGDTCGMANSPELRATYRKRGTGWEGVVKDSMGRVVTACGHYHHNRDQGSFQRGEAARDCAWQLLRELVGSDEYKTQRWGKK